MSRQKSNGQSKEKNSSRQTTYQTGSYPFFVHDAISLSLHEPAQRSSVSLQRYHQGFSSFERRRIRSERGDSQRASPKRNPSFFMCPPRHLAATLHDPNKNRNLRVLCIDILDAYNGSAYHHYIHYISSSRRQQERNDVPGVDVSGISSLLHHTDRIRLA